MCPNAHTGKADGRRSPEICRRCNDPSTVKARETAKEAAEKETKALSPQEMAYKMGTGW